MSVQVEVCESHERVGISGFLDGHTAESRELLDFLEERRSGARGHHVLDLSEVEYVNSSMLGEFLRFLHALQSRGYRVLLMNPPPSVANVLELTGLSALLPVVANDEEVEEQLQQDRKEEQPSEPVDYAALANEIEAMVKGDLADESPGESQLGRILED